MLSSFKTALRLAEDELYSKALAQLKKLASKAIDCLVRNMDNEASAFYRQVAGRAISEASPIIGTATKKTQAVCANNPRENSEPGEKCNVQTKHNSSKKMSGLANGAAPKFGGSGRVIPGRA